MRFLVFLALAFAFAGCGAHAYNHEAETEGEYVDVGNLVYQVQMSRFLNPGDVEDRQYLQGLPAGTAQIGADETWFGVWMRVKNYSNDTLPTAEDIFILDTEEERYDPVPLAPTSPFAYHPRQLGPDAVLPTPDSAAASGPIQGELILYRLKNDSVQNRPLTLHIEQAGSESSEISLDL